MRRPDPGAVPANLAAEPQPGVGWERVDVHFSGKGLRAHGKAWADKVSAWLEEQIAPEGVPAANDRATNPRPATPEQMQWFRDAKFGLFLSWGPGSLSGMKLSWGRRCPRPFRWHVPLRRRQDRAPGGLRQLLQAVQPREVLDARQ